jgi:hypothetical protein
MDREKRHSGKRSALSFLEGAALVRRRIYASHETADQSGGTPADADPWVTSDATIVRRDSVTLPAHVKRTGPTRSPSLQ